MKVEEVKFGNLPEKIGKTVLTGRCFLLPHADDVELLFPQIIKALKKEYKKEEKESYYRGFWAGERRTLKILPRIATSKETTRGQLLVSLFCNTYCQRKSRPIHTKVIADILQPEFSEAPESINYNLDFWERGLSDEQKEQLRTEGIQDECVVLRKHQTRASEAFVACDACNGTGRLRCPACGGSGREQYVDGYYASGEERIKTGSCSECQGHGQVPCPDCQGQGRIEIFSQNYTVEKSVTETWKQHTVIAYNSPSMGWNCRVVLFADFDDANDESLFNLPHYDFDFEEYDSGKKAVQDAVSDNDCIRLKMKNRKEILEDNTCAYDEAMQRFGLLAAYKMNCEYADSSPMTPEGELVCRQERHYIIPVTRIRINTHRLADEESDDRPFDIYVLPQDDKQDVVMVNRDFEGMGKAEYLFTLLFKKRQPWAEIKTKRE